ncbi:TolC family protein, partial [Sulfuricurvum sp. RIFOXYD2_FULL_44_160]
MKRNPLFLALIPLSLLSADTVSLLSPEKKTVLKYQQDIYESEHQKLRYNWISPLNLNAIYDYDKSPQGGYHSDTETLSASISQDIFRSGGITYQIKYADAKKQSETIRLQKDIALYNQQLFIALLNYRKNSVLLDQSRKRLENKGI